MICSKAELEAMVRDGKGRVSVVKMLAQKELGIAIEEEKQADEYTGSEITMAIRHLRKFSHQHASGLLLGFLIDTLSDTGMRYDDSTDLAIKMYRVITGEDYR